MPAEYQEVDYIESTGTQYIETQIFPKINDVIVIDVQNTSNSSSEQAIMGVREASAGKAIDFYYQSGKPIFWIDYSGSESVGPNESYYNEKIRYEASYNSSGMQLKINDNTYSKTKVFGDAAFTGPYYIFAYNASGTPSAKFSGRIYNIEIYSDGELAHKFQPCYRISDNEIGLYDKIEGKFYVNKGTGNFKKENDTGYITPSTELIDNKDHTLYAVWGHNPIVAFDANGGSVSLSTKTYEYNSNYTDLPVPTRYGYIFKGWEKYDLPSGYQAIDYLESKGSQYIYTDLGVNENDEFETKSSTNSTGNYHTIIGSASGAVFELYYNIPNVATYGTISILSGQTTGINSGEAYIHRTKATSNSSNFEIFSYNKQYNLNGKIYYVKWFRNGELIHNFIPCVRVKDDVEGLFEINSNVFYVNSGSGTFTRGSNIYNSDLFSTVDSTNIVIEQNHTLYAKWEKEE